ncbi:hypothetical protein GJU40_17110 [Bacillus lacus]|uniref:Uncharacterized protein n=1 Tax=Metabacillus lacus TaxID=1983721 RepID=A0A7X2M195_9BACI|nr:hypothetical protein [Metabacillus lacus]MRX73864.1 hypothetical protein [Metabacillus lacus]
MKVYNNIWLCTGFFILVLNGSGIGFILTLYQFGAHFGLAAYYFMILFGFTVMSLTEELAEGMQYYAKLFKAGLFAALALPLYCLFFSSLFIPHLLR